MPKPSWLKTRLPTGAEFDRVNELLRKFRLNTVCSNARCPNLTECWNAGTATLMILGDICTRSCRFCAVKKGNPGGKVDETEPERVAQLVQELGIRYLVLTSVDRDDLLDLGAGMFARTVQRVKQTPLSDVKRKPGSGGQQVRVEVLVPDFGCRLELIQQVVNSGPDVFGHNIETVERLTPLVRDRRANYRLSLAVLQKVKELMPEMVTKSGLMVGLGETMAEVVATLEDLRAVGCDIVTVGQYLQPSRRALPVARYWHPEEFEKIQAAGEKMGFKKVFAAPLVRSSYRAAELFG
ncbi:MAG: lipoyl synthase [candidate division WOR-3 bacterium]|nr:lipoyl synthase [candidate division WOR-3 bacterium]MCR4424241.1 lipoyl synthase [candidate division WOR-3 bacterium]MDH7519341.1 lipoyl synthase [bacterium]